MNSKIPLKKTNLYTTVEDFQSAVNMDIRQGNRLIASENTLLGEFLLEGLSHKLKGQVNIEGSITIKDCDSICKLANFLNPAV